MAAEDSIKLPRSLILEDQALFSGFLVQALEMDGRFGASTTVSSLTAAIALLDAGHVFDVYWLDLHLPDGSGMDLAQRVSRLGHTSRIVFISGQRDPASVKQALLLNFQVFISKEEPLTVFDEALDAVIAGRVFYSPRVMRILGEIDVSSGDLSELTSRERTVLKLSAEGLSMKEISVQMGIAESTVKTYRKALLQKLNARNVADLTRIALKNGLVSTV